MALLLWIIAVILAVLGIVRIISGDIAVGLVLIVLACLVGPGGVSLFT